jgi:hypothetical protein
MVFLLGEGFRDDFIKLLKNNGLFVNIIVFLFCFISNVTKNG